MSPQEIIELTALALALTGGFIAAAFGLAGLMAAWAAWDGDDS